MGRPADSGWDVRVEGNTAVVELRRRLTLDDRASERLYDDIASVVTDNVDRVLTVVDVEHPLSETLHDAVVRAAATAAGHGVTDWRVVGEHESKATAVAQALPAVETTVFADEQQARLRAA